MIKCNGKIEAEKGIIHYDCEIVLDRGNGNGQSKSGKIKMKKQKKVTKTFYHTVQKNNQTLQRVIEVEKKKSKNKKYASQFTLANVKIVTDCEIKTINKTEIFTVSTSCGDFEFDKLIIAAGSNAVPKTGSDGSGYGLAIKLGHKVKK